LWVTALLVASTMMNSVDRNKLRIVAAGRGRSMCLDPIVKAVLDLTDSIEEKEIRLVYLGTATYDKNDAFEAQTHAYSRLSNCKVIKLEVSEAAQKNLSHDEIRDVIDSAHVIMVSGGNTLYAVKRWKQLKIDAMIRNCVIQKNPPPVLCGGSAGAICWFEYGHSDSMDPTTFFSSQSSDDCAALAGSLELKASGISLRYAYHITTLPRAMVSRDHKIQMPCY
jgi:peptidase E